MIYHNIYSRIEMVFLWYSKVNQSSWETTRRKRRDTNRISVVYFNRVINTKDIGRGFFFVRPNMVGDRYGSFVTLSDCGAKTVPLMAAGEERGQFYSP